jgi:hypothetical protein
MKLKTILLILLSAALYSCAPSHFVKPLSAKQQAVSLSLGGPLIKYSGLTIPVPMLAAAYGYGIDSSLTAFGALNFTSAAFGNAHIDLGVTKQFLKQKEYIPALSVSPVATIIYRNTNARKFYPQLDLNAFWEYGKQKNYFYVGISNWFELAQTRSEGVAQPNHWLFIPQAGYTFVFSNSSLTLEAKVIAPNLPNDKVVVDYQTPFNTHGAFGVYVSYIHPIK